MNGARPPLGRLAAGNTLIGVGVVLTEAAVNGYLLTSAPVLERVLISFGASYLIALVALWAVVPTVRSSLARLVRVTSFVAVPMVLYESILNGVVLAPGTSSILRIGLSFGSGWVLSFTLILVGFSLFRGPIRASGIPVGG